jgi:C1A family cysteine protease
MYKIERYGWIKDSLDHRDFKYKASRSVTKTIPSLIDLRAGCPAIYDQMALGSCVANGTAAAAEFCMIKEGHKRFVPSRLFIYYCARSLEGTIGSDSGAMIRDGMKAIAKWGFPDEQIWPYDITKFKKTPPHQVYGAAWKEITRQYQSVPQNITQMKGCLVEGYPIVVGFSVFDAFESDAVAKTGIVPMPSSTDQPIGGHCVLVVGADDSKKWWICRNSWGVNWGDLGYFYLPMDYLLNSQLADDFWTVRLVP